MDAPRRHSCPQSSCDNGGRSMCAGADVIFIMLELEGTDRGAEN